MKVQTITYQKTVPIAQFLNDRIGVEVSVAEGENADQVFQLAKDLVEKWAKQLAAPSQIAEIPAPYSSPLPPPVIDLADEKKEIDLDNSISAAKTLQELAALKQGLPASLMPHYMDKLKSLTK